MEGVKKYLVFETGKGLFGINLKYILKIKNNIKYYKLPAMEKKYLGVTQFENRFIPLVRFNKFDDLENNEGNTSLILRYRISEFAVFIKNIIDIYDIENKDIFDEEEKFTYIENKKVILINLEDFLENKYN